MNIIVFCSTKLRKLRERKNDEPLKNGNRRGPDFSKEAFVNLRLNEEDGDRLPTPTPTRPHRKGGVVAGAAGW